MRLTPALAARVAAAPDGPLARQFLASAAEARVAPEELLDPIGDHAHEPAPGLIHRYPDRVLLKALHVCPVYCRFCFRREDVGPGGHTLNDQELAAALDYVRGQPAIWEVILSGGDPLLLSARRLDQILTALDGIAHVQVVRIHTRIPVIAPELLDHGRLEVLQRRRLPLWVAVHVNHADEFTAEARAALEALIDAGATLVGQTVLLRGVNDDAEVLEQLFRTMVQHRIRPYYLHHPDLAPGTGHFRLSLDEGQAIVAALRGRLSGLCLPTYVLDIPGGHGKVPVGPTYLAPGRVRDPQGKWHDYPC